MKATFDNFQLLADRDLYEAMLKKYNCQSYGDNKIAIKTNNSFASWMVAEKVGDKYKITPITSQNNERQSLQMEAYWTTLKEFPIKEYSNVPQFYKQWFVNRGLMKENKMIGEKKMKLTRERIREIIVEEYQKLNEVKVGTILKHNLSNAELEVTKISGNNITTKFLKMGNIKTARVGQINKINKQLIGKTYTVFKEGTEI